MTAPGHGDRVAELTARLAAIRSRLALAADAAGRRPQEVQLLPVTKFFPASDVAILWRLGCRAFGESREQEAAAKIAEFGRLVAGGPEDDGARWHMVGQIQSNKAKHIAGWADTVHSVSTTKVATALEFTRQMVSNRGQVTDEEVAKLRKAGFTDGEITEILANIGLTLFTNYFNHVVGTEVDFPAVSGLEARV